MRRVKILISILLLGVLSYYVNLYVFTGLKVHGYSYLISTAAEPYDLVIKYAEILDGSGVNDRFRGDIAIRDGYIVAVGFVNAQDSPVFDAGGLTVLPYPVALQKNGRGVEHLLATSYPRFPASEIYLTQPPYDGLNLTQIAFAQGLPIDETFNKLKNALPPETKAYLISFPFESENGTNRELAAQLTGHRAQFYGLKDCGIVQSGYQADFYLYKTRDYTDEDLNRLLRKGSFPDPLYKIDDGKFLNQ